ncbi:MAG: helix-turn-helix transcriptional regulator [Oligoflexia bacterium]|nr:helix-turn-helix transcriptional regulator [Oligoflexia bacterium]
MRLSRSVSQERAALMIGCSESAIGHYETGRMDISELRLKQFLKTYRYGKDDFDEYMNGRPIPISLKDECVGLLNKLDETKLKAVHSVLLGFTA